MTHVETASSQGDLSIPYMTVLFSKWGSWCVWLTIIYMLLPKSHWDCYKKNNPHSFNYMRSVLIKGAGIDYSWCYQTWAWCGISGYFAVPSVFPQWEQNRSFVYFGRNKHKQADRFVLKPHGKEEVRDAILQVRTDYFIFSLLSIP